MRVCYAGLWIVSGSQSEKWSAFYQFQWYSRCYSTLGCHPTVSQFRWRKEHSRISAYCRRSRDAPVDGHDPRNAGSIEQQSIDPCYRRCLDSFTRVKSPQRSTSEADFRSSSRESWSSLPSCIAIGCKRYHTWCKIAHRSFRKEHGLTERTRFAYTVSVCSEAVVIQKRDKTR